MLLLAPSLWIHPVCLPADPVFGRLPSTPFHSSLPAGPGAVAQLFKSDAHMAYVKLPSVTDAMLALMRVHNHRLQGRFLRVSFSAKDVETFDASSSGGSNSHSHAAAASSSSSNSSNNAAQNYDGQPKHDEDAPQDEQPEDGMHNE